MRRVWTRLPWTLALVGYLFVYGAPLRAAASQDPPASGGEPAGAPVVPAGYVIGVEDVLSIVFWKDKEMSADVVVRPDGKISLPLLNDVQTAGSTPEQLGQALVAASSKYIEQATVTVIVKEINSRKVFILGQVAKPGAFPLIGTMNVLQLIALAGGVLEYADAKNVTVVRKENGEERRFKFNYKDVVKGKNEQQNIQLQPGDTVVVP